MKNLYKKLILLTVSVMIIFNITLSDTSYAQAAINQNTTEVSLGGMPFGVKFFSQGIVVVGFSDVSTHSGSKTPAYDAGLRINDIITHVNGIPVKTSAELIKTIEKSIDSVEITYLRNGAENTVKFVPTESDLDGKMKTGMWVRDTTAGIGTVTFIVPQTGEFAGLGHGICDTETGELLKMERGTVVGVQISGITKGICGTPGELKGYFTSDKTGVLLENTLCGVYGIMSDIPTDLIPQDNIKIGKRDSVHNGEAYIWCTLDESAPQKYTIEISDIDRNSHDNRSFTVKVTDSNLIEKTGGIIQGMSGSPIIQDGCLIGAVTHVLVNDPSRGYGIFIENMLDIASPGTSTDG